MTIEKFMKKHWEEFAKEYGYNSMMYLIPKDISEYEFWIQKAKELYAAETKKDLQSQDYIVTDKLTGAQWEPLKDKISGVLEPKLEWQPAKSAPRDGTKFLGIIKNEKGWVYIAEALWAPFEAPFTLLGWLPLSALPPIPPIPSIPEEKKYYN
jgi:hypothetical protein